MIEKALEETFENKHIDLIRRIMNLYSKVRNVIVVLLTYIVQLL